MHTASMVFGIGVVIVGVVLSLAGLVYLLSLLPGTTVLPWWPGLLFLGLGAAAFFGGIKITEWARWRMGLLGQRLLYIVPLVPVGVVCVYVGLALTGVRAPSQLDPLEIMDGGTISVPLVGFVFIAGATFCWWFAFCVWRASPEHMRKLWHGR